MKTTNCPICRLPKGHAKDHHLSRCPFTEAMGLETTYTKATSQRLANYDKKKARAAKVKLQDENDAGTDATKGLVQKHDGSFFSANETKWFNKRQAKKKKICDKQKQPAPS